MRKLATVRIIKELYPIKKADLIELAIIDGWQVVVKRGEFQIGDKCVYIEIDSLVPPTKPFQFMEPRKYKVKTIKLRDCLSQGLALPLHYFNLQNKKEGDDLTELLQIVKYNDDSGEVSKPKSKLNTFLFQFNIVRWIYFKFNKKIKSSWPDFIPKTDEERVQNIRDLSRNLEGVNIYATEKLDGQSFTAFYHGTLKTGLFKKGIYGVCSRNIWFKHPKTTNNTWCNISIKHNIESILKNYFKQNKVALAIQGEIIGPGIQGNKYACKENKLFIYNIYNITLGKYLNLSEKMEFLKLYKTFEHVPIVLLELEEIKTVPYFLQQAEGISLLNKCEREGIVVRTITDDAFSFKAISNKFLLKEK